MITWLNHRVLPRRRINTYWAGGYFSHFHNLDLRFMPRSLYFRFLFERLQSRFGSGCEGKNCCCYWVPNQVTSVCYPRLTVTNKMSSKALKRGKRENMVKSREHSEISQGEMRDSLIIFKGQIASNARRFQSFAGSSLW